MIVKSADMAVFRDEYIKYLEQTKKSSQNTLLAYARDINKFYDYASEFNIISFDQVDVDTISDYKNYLKAKALSSSSISRALSALRSLMQYLLVNGVVENNPAKEVHNDKLMKHGPSILSGKEIERLLAQPSGTDAKSIRDKAILELLYATGIKVSELISLDVMDFNLQLSIIRCSKGSKERVIPLYPLAAKALADYVSGARKMLVFRADEQALFVNVSGERMTRQGLWKLIKGYASAADIFTVITPHTLRHSFAAHLLENGADIHDIQEILGHTDISSTQRYAQFLKNYHKKDYMKFHPRA